MPRILDEPLSQTGAGAGATPTFTQVRALTSVAAGALMTVTEQGGARQSWTQLSDLSQLTTEVSSTDGVLQAMPLQRVNGAISFNVAPVNDGSANNGLHVNGKLAVLNNGAVVSCWAVVTSSTWQLSVMIDNVAGRTVPIEVVVATGLTMRPYARVVALSNGNFVVVWVQSAALRHRIYGPTGAAISSEMTISSSSAPGIDRHSGSGWSVIASGAGYIIAGLGGYANDDGGSNTIGLRRYDATGASVGSTVQRNHGGGTTQQGHALTLTRCANGDIVVAYSGSNSGEFSLWRFTATLAYVFGRVAVSNKTWTLNEDSSREQNVWELANGNLVVSSGDSGTFDVYSAAGTLLTSSSTGLDIDVVDVVPEATGNWVVFGVVSDSIVAARYDARGRVINPPSTVLPSTPFKQRLTGQIRAFSLGPAGFVVVSKSANTGTPPGGSVTGWAAQVFGVNPNLTARGTAIVTRTSSTSFLEAHGIMTQGGQLYYMMATAGDMFRGVYHPARASIIGVAQGAVSAGQFATVQTAGLFDLPAGQVLNLSPTPFDGRTATPPGPRGQIIENQVALQGMI